jgi:DNA-binding XRE family transcriptional regulator
MGDEDNRAKHNQRMTQERQRRVRQGGVSPEAAEEGTRLYHKREILGISARTLAESAGVSHLTVHNAERGLVRITPETRAKINRAIKAEALRKIADLRTLIKEG